MRSEPSVARDRPVPGVRVPCRIAARSVSALASAARHPWHVDSSVPIECSPISANRSAWAGSRTSGLQPTVAGWLGANPEPVVGPGSERLSECDEAHPAARGNDVSQAWSPVSVVPVRAFHGFVRDGAHVRRAAIVRFSLARLRQGTRPARVPAEARYGMTGRGEVALRARWVCGEFADDRLELLPERTLARCRITTPRRGDADRITAQPPPAVRRLPLWREFVADAPHRAGWLGLPPREQATGSPVAAARCGFVRRRPTGRPTSLERRLTIRARAAINEWTPDDRSTAEARGFARRVSSAPVVRPRLGAWQTRVGRCAEDSVCVRGMASSMVHVRNVTLPRTGSVQWRTCDGSHPISPSGRSARARSGADWRMPVRWRTVAE